MKGTEVRMRGTDMFKTVEGVYRNGKIELLEIPTDMDETRVIVTFLSSKGPVALREHGIDEAQAASLRARLAPIAEDWDDPAMNVYDEL